MNFCYVNHGHDMVECCALETPCPFHAQFSGAVRSPVADIERDSAITQTLIEIAQALVCISSDEFRSPEREEMAKVSGDFLRLWYKRKIPSLEMPKF